MTYFEDPISGSPFVSKAWDASLVLVSNVATAVIGKPSHFNSEFHFQISSVDCLDVFQNNKS